MQSKLRECMLSGGAEEITFDQSGGSTVSFSHGMSERAQRELSQRCSDEAGEAGISVMYYEMRRNPENLDEFTIMADCLVRKGVVDPSYSAKDYEEWFESDREWPTEGGAGITATQQCNQDPLGLYE